MIPEPSNEKEVLDINEIVNRYRGMWVAMKVLERDKNHQPTKGVVIYADPDRYRLRMQVINENELCI
ncbi:MAG: hypothetical protein QXW58_05695, partial [Thermosphaera sp.]